MWFTIIKGLLGKLQIVFMYGKAEGSLINMLEFQHLLFCGLQKLEEQS